MNHSQTINPVGMIAGVASPFLAVVGLLIPIALLASFIAALTGLWSAFNGYQQIQTGEVGEEEMIKVYVAGGGGALGCLVQLGMMALTVFLTAVILLVAAS